MRPGRIETFLDLAKVIAKRSTCKRAQVGCVITDDHNRVVGVGYNGNPPGLPHCIGSECFSIDGHCITTTHAEINAITTMRNGFDNRFYNLYCTHSPCLTCLKVGVNMGIREWYFITHYVDIYRDEFIKWYNKHVPSDKMIYIERISEGSLPY